MSQHNNTRMFCVHFLVCQQDSTESLERISSKPEGKDASQPRIDLVNFWSGSGIKGRIRGCIF